MAVSPAPEPGSAPSQDLAVGQAAADPGAMAPGKPRLKPVPRREPGYFAVIILLVLDIVIGLGLAVFGEKVMEFRPIAVAGLGLAGIGLVILAYFVLFGSGKRR